MPQQSTPSASRSSDSVETTHDEPDAEPTPGEQVRQWARLIAAGEIDWPEELPVEVEAELIRAVRAEQRARIVDLIARLIAADLIRNHESGE